MAAASGPSTVSVHGECGSVCPTRQELLKEMRCFVKGSLQDGNLASVDVARSGLYLLKTLPSARGAVMEHLCNVFDAAVKSHIMQKELNKPVPENTELEGVIEDVKDVILGFVKSNPTAWAPIISAWAIELLGHISSKYAERSGVPHSSLNEVLQVWMTCPATKSLIDIASQCFSSMVGNTPDSCVDALLEASVKHSPHFDWVVAHIGSCFPTTIISRVLLCGLRDFCLHGESGKPSRKEPKVGSVVSILGHLATRHGQDIRQSVMKLFKESLQCEKDNLMSSVTPFLLHLASLSPMLLTIMSQDFVQTASPEVLNKLMEQMAGKPNKTFDGSNLLDLITHLVTQCELAAFALLKFLLQISSSNSDGTNRSSDQLHPTIHKTAKSVMDKMLSDLERLLLVRKSGSLSMSPFLQGLQNHCPDLCEFMLKAEKISAHWLQRILICMCLQSNEATSAEILYSILERNDVPPKLSYFMEILHAIQWKYPDVLGVTVSMCMQKMVTYHEGNEKMLQNLTHLLRWEFAGSSRWIGLRLQFHLAEQLDMLGQLLEEDISSASLSLIILSLIKMPQELSVSKSVKLTQAVVSYFFRVMHLADMTMKVSQCDRCSKLIINLSKLPTIQKTLLRLLVEESISEKNCMLFGAKRTTESPARNIKEHQELLTDNLKRGQAVADLRPRQGTLFHGGIIGQGLLLSSEVPDVPQEHVSVNRSFILETVWNLCCSGQQDNGQGPSSKMPPSRNDVAFSLLLIEIITPDVMYNGIPWLEEDFCKVTVRRDLLISRKLDENPILWEYLDIAASCSGSFYYCSTIMRSVTATLITFWEGCREKTASGCQSQLEVTCRLVQTMRKGGLLLPPLCFVDELFSYLPPFEVAVILHDLWLFMHEKPPLPNAEDNAQRMSEPKPYLDAIKNVLHNHIDTLGHLFAHFFPAEKPS